MMHLLVIFETTKETPGEQVLSAYRNEKEQEEK